jgi:hypothetical protein
MPAQACPELVEGLASPGVEQEIRFREIPAFAGVTFDVKDAAANFPLAIFLQKRPIRHIR